MLVVIASDPRTSHRPAEAVRVAAGLASFGSIPLEVCFCEAAALILSQPSNSFVDGDVIRQHLALLNEHAKAIYAESGDPFLEGQAQVDYRRVGLTELAELAKKQAQVIRF